MSNELRNKIKAAWPEYALTHGRCCAVPPVREGGMTSALIDLSVKLAAEHYENKTVEPPQFSNDATERGTMLVSTLDDGRVQMLLSGELNGMWVSIEQNLTWNEAVRLGESLIRRGRIIGEMGQS